MIGNTILHYKILEKLGEGGMGVVYKALDTSLNRNVALKFLPPHLTSDPSLRKRFINEAKAASALDHPNICTIHEINETEDDQLYICMAYYEGESLNQKIKKGPLLFDESMHIFSQVAQGLRAAHEEKIIHRDIKPGNIIITEKGEAKIVDFGLATLAGEKITESVSTKGTIAYMAPEIINGSPADQRSDLWALGIVLFEMLTGHLPFKGEYPEPVMYSIVNEEPEKLSQYLTNVPGSLQTVIDKLLKKDPEERYQSIREMLADLKQFVKEDEFAVIKSRFTIKKLFHRKRNYVYGITAFVLAIIIFLIVGKSYFFPERNLRNSIAVLPLENIINNDEQEWFTDGMTDELITNLAQISQLKVISRSSSMKYKRTTKNPPVIGEELGVSYLVDGSVVRRGDVVKISARLISAGEDKYIWAKEYERKFTNVLELHKEIAKAIAEQISIQLTPQENILLTKSRTINPATYEMYLKGMYHINRRTPESIEKGLSYLQQAVESDSTEPLAWAGLALGYCIIAHTPSPAADSPRLAKQAALKALALDDNLGEVHLAIAMIDVYFEWDLTGAGEQYRRAIELNPNIPLAYLHYAWYNILMGNPEEAPKLLQKAIELDPLSNIYPAELAWMNYFSGEYDKTIELSLQSLELIPDFPFALFTLGEGYAGKGMYDKAIEVQKKSSELSPYWKFGLGHTYALAGYKDKALKIADELVKRSTIWDTYGLAVIYSALEDKEKTFYWLEKAYEKRHPYIQWIRRGGYFDTFKEDPRFEDLVMRMNLPK
jgi:serine/threonine protein kinase